MDYASFQVFIEVQTNPYALGTIYSNFNNNKQIVLTAVSYFGSALEFASDELKNDKEVVLVAVSNNGYSLQYASYNLKNDKDIILTAISNVN
jgi:hypothetical protein